MGFAKYVAAVAMAGTIGSAQAVTIDNGTFTTDTLSGLDWLDVTQTNNLSYSAIKSDSGGWMSAGWRIATGEELRTLFSEYIGTGPELTFYGDAYTNALQLVRQLGVTISFNNSEGIRQVYGANEPYQIAVSGWFDDGIDNGIIGVASLTARFPENSYQASSSRWVVYDDFWSFGSATNLNGTGGFLVRPSLSTVPLPPTALLMASALGLLGLTHRNRKYV